MVAQSNTSPDSTPAMANGSIKYKRILLKMSGEYFQGTGHHCIDLKRMDRVAEEIRELKEMGVDVGLVMGAGNIVRGAEVKHMERASADYIGMVATMVNALMMQGVLERLGVETRVMSAIEMQQVSEPYIRRRALRHLERGIVVIFGGGTGNPFFTTDTAAALRANEIGADILMKATKVDGVYDADPMKVPDAKLFTRLEYQQVVAQNLRVMDTSAVSLCRDNKLPILVFNLDTPGNIQAAVKGEPVGTLVC